MKATAKMIALVLAAGTASPSALWGQAPPTGAYAAPPLAGSPSAGFAAPPRAGAPAAAPIPGAARAQSDAMLRQARQLLADGNAQGAAQIAQQAARLGAVYQLNEDSPAKIEALVRRQAEMVKGPAPGASPQLFQRQYAQFLMDQADGLMGYRDFARAQALVSRAAGLQAEYGQFERTPQKLMQQIAAVQAGFGSPAGALPQQARPAAPIAGMPPATLPRQAAAPIRPAGNAGQAKQQALALVARAQAALDAHDIAAAERLAERARALNVPDSLYGPDEVRPWQVLLEVGRAKARNPVVQASAVEPVGGPGYPVQQGLYRPDNDATRNERVQAQSPLGGFDPLRAQAVPTPAAPIGPQTGPPAAPAPAGPPVVVSQGDELFRLGIQQLTAGDRQTALEHFREAWQYEAELDLVTRARLRDKLAFLQQAAPNPLPTGQSPSPLQQLTQQQQVALQALQAQMAGEMRAARDQKSADPKGALNRLQKLRQDIQGAELNPPLIKSMLTSVDRQIADMERYVELNRGIIELDEQNNNVRQGINADRERMIQVQDQIAEFVDQFNKLLDEQRFAEAEVIAKKARELEPNLAVVENMAWKSRFARQMAANLTRQDLKERNFTAALDSVEDSSIPFDDRFPINFNGAERWRDLTDTRRRLLGAQTRYSEEELQIQKNLRTKVDVKFDNAPLAQVIQTLADYADVPVFVDENGLRLEAVSTDHPVNISISQPIMLMSALNLILEPLGLSYVIENEVLKVTTAEVKDADVYTEVYNVGDLVIPIPNFVPGYDIGLPAAIREAHAAIGYGGMPTSLGGGAHPIMYANNQQQPQQGGPSFLAQMSRSGMLPGSSRPNQPLGTGPGGAGGAALADFDTLIELITTTIAPDSWDEVGGPGAVESFPTNLSLVVSQTQDVHEQISDLLDQLRRLQDLQIAIEVRFITLTDNFFERIGIDFDFDIDDNSLLGNGTPVTLYPDDIGPSVSFGLDSAGNPTADLDFQFRQDSFGASAPQFGGFDPMTAANFGFAILSDIEVFFVLQAAHGDQRSNVLQAPKVTLFNGQSASVADTSQRPFVTSIIPVVGDFAIGQQPVITVLSEGTSLSVQGVISADRRFVRLTLVPFFSQIGEVDTFTFQGRQTSNSGTQILDAEGNPTGVADGVSGSNEGSTVQLPTFSFTTVSTTVSVPDGGTVLLGGIKRLREGRNERGVPMLAKLPYVSRLFKNVGIGRDTQSLMLMVTPRIIIQEEEEDKIGVNAGP